MCQDCVKLFDSLDPATYAAIETLRPVLTKIFASINSAANADVDVGLDPVTAGHLFGPFVAGYLAGEHIADDEQADSVIELFESGLTWGILRRQAALSRRVN